MRRALGFWVKSSSVPVYEPDFQTYLDALTVPLSTTQKTYINDFYVSIKTGYSLNMLSDAFDALWYTGNETAESSYKNLVKRLHDAEGVNSPVWIQYEGIAGDGISKYIDLNWNGRNDGINYTLNSASFGVYFRTLDRSGTKYNGTYSTTVDGGTANGIIIGSAAGTDLYYSLNSTLSPVEKSSVTDGFIVLNRVVSTEFIRNRNKSKSTISRTSSKIPNQELVVSARRTTDTTVGLFNTSQIALVFVGKGLTDSGDIIIDAFETLMDKNGKGII